MLGSMLLPVMEALFTVYKTKMPKKPTPEFKENVSTPIRENFKKFTAMLETVQCPAIDEYEFDLSETATTANPDLLRDKIKALLPKKVEEYKKEKRIVAERIVQMYA